jgi:hypothetical protein
MVALFSPCLCTGLHAVAAVVLAHPDAYAARLHGGHSDHQSLAAAKAMDLSRRLHDAIRAALLATLAVSLTSRAVLLFTTLL